MYYTASASQLNGAITLPPSKSHTLRALLFALLAHGTSHIKNPLPSPDTTAMIKACQQLGATIQQDNNVLRVTGTAGTLQIADDIIDAGNSGQVLRFITTLAALTDGTTIITGDHSIRYNRPMQPLIDALPPLGAQCRSSRNNGFAPLIIQGPLKAGHTQLIGTDSQPVSALLMAATQVHGDTLIDVVQPGETPWIDLTLDWFKTIRSQLRATAISTL